VALGSVVAPGYAGKNISDFNPFAASENSGRVLDQSQFLGSKIESFHPVILKRHPSKGLFKLTVGSKRTDPVANVMFHLWIAGEVLNRDLVSGQEIPHLFGFLYSHQQEVGSCDPALDAKPV
jgi:hypothetical protein